MYLLLNALTTVSPADASGNELVTYIIADTEQTVAWQPCIQIGHTYTFPSLRAGKVSTNANIFTVVCCV
jgi:hypothetical protein